MGSQLTELSKRRLTRSPKGETAVNCLGTIQRKLHMRPTHALRVRQPNAFILNFWQRYASYATGTTEASVANEGHPNASVAKLCFPIGKMILPATSPFVSPLDPPSGINFPR